MPRHASGRLVRYGGDYLARVNADFHGYTLPASGCGLAVMSPADLGKLVWVRVPGGPWVGPCRSVDVAKRTDFLAYVNDLEEIVEITDSTRAQLGITENVFGEAYVGQCPPERETMAAVYHVNPRFSTEPTPSFCCPYAEQEREVKCNLP